MYFGEYPFKTNVEGNIRRYYDNIINQKKPFKKIEENKKLQDLLDKIFEIDEKKRISWDNYFQHEFFVENNKIKLIYLLKINNYFLKNNYLFFIK